MTHRGEYPPDWKAIRDRVRADAGHRCIRCLHPYRPGQHGNGQWSPCDERCTHNGPTRSGFIPTIREAQWRILTVHHMDGNKANCEWWNLLSLCQRCHLQIQGKVDPNVPWLFEHSTWIKPYVAGFYAWKYERRQITRAEAEAEMPRLLSLERMA